MRFRLVFVALLGAALLTSCAKKDADTAATDAAAQSPAGPHATVHLKDGSKVSGAIVASTPTEMTVDTDKGGERVIPLSDVKSVDYGGAAPASRNVQSAKTSTNAAPAQKPVTTKTYMVPVGREISVRTNETIDSSKANEGQTFDAQLTRDVTDENGDLVIPRGADARIVIKSAAKGGRFRGQSDLVLDLQSVVINGRAYNVGTADLTKLGKQGVGANKRTAEFTGGGAALGAIIGAIAGGGKGAAIGAAAGAGAGVATQVATKGGSIKVPVETVLTFKLDQPLRVVEAQ